MWAIDVGNDQISHFSGFWSDGRKMRSCHFAKYAWGAIQSFVARFDTGAEVSVHCDQFVNDFVGCMAESAVNERVAVVISCRGAVRNVGVFAFHPFGSRVVRNVGVFAFCPFGSIFLPF